MTVLIAAARARPAGQYSDFDCAANLQKDGARGSAGGARSLRNLGGSHHIRARSGVGGEKMERNLSIEAIKALNKIVRTCRHLRDAMGREPTPEEVAGRQSMPPETIRKALGARAHSPDIE